MATRHWCGAFYGRQIRERPDLRASFTKSPARAGGLAIARRLRRYSRVEHSWTVRFC